MNAGAAAAVGAGVSNVGIVALDAPKGDAPVAPNNAIAGAGLALCAPKTGAGWLAAGLPNNVG